MPLVLHLGDFLQLRPTAGRSLMDDMSALALRQDGADAPAEFQDAARLFLQTGIHGRRRWAQRWHCSACLVYPMINSASCEQISPRVRVYAGSVMASLTLPRCGWTTSSQFNSRPRQTSFQTLMMFWLWARKSCCMLFDNVWWHCPGTVSAGPLGALLSDEDLLRQVAAGRYTELRHMARYLCPDEATKIRFP